MAHYDELMSTSAEIFHISKNMSIKNERGSKLMQFVAAIAGNYFFTAFSSFFDSLKLNNFFSEHQRDSKWNYVVLDKSYTNDAPRKSSEQRKSAWATN